MIHTATIWKYKLHRSIIIYIRYICPLCLLQTITIPPHGMSYLDYKVFFHLVLTVWQMAWISKENHRNPRITFNGICIDLQKFSLGCCTETPDFISILGEQGAWINRNWGGKSMKKRILNTKEESKATKHRRKKSVREARTRGSTRDGGDGDEGDVGRATRQR